ncbi:flavin reductase family protein [Sporobolomyces koalae]|uniref:flavin reductase family protein n=1 Tax=Sporobolomyces koalae TaxID=500713 RepID=UPI00316C10CA
MSHHPPFKQVEASRPDFDRAKVLSHSKTPNPDWQIGSGASFPADSKGTKSTESTFEINPDEIEKGDKGKLYKMLISAVTPRPIAFVASVDRDGHGNLAPFSYFQMVAHDPPTIMVSFSHPSPTELKGTCENILTTKQFTTNIISEHYLEAANYTSIDAPKGQSEWPLSGLTQVKSTTIDVPRVGESKFSMECELLHSYDIVNDAQERTGTVVLGRVRYFHINEDIINKDTFLVDTAALKPVSRLGGISYARTTEAYELPRPVWKNEKERDEVKKVLQDNKL